jgi:predicted dehydrogenase
MSKDLKVAVIGTGGISNSHMAGWEASPHTRVVAGADVSEANLTAWGKKHSIARLEKDWRRLVDDPAIHLIDICTPNMFHTEIAIAAMEAGKHVICEKPLAPTPAEIKKLIQVRDRTKRLLMTAQHMRFIGQHQAMKAEIATGCLGRIYHSRAWMLRRAAIPTRPGFVLKAQSGGGPCIDIGVHVLDLTLWLIGNPVPTAVSGVARTEIATQPGAFSIWGGQTVPKEIDVEDFAAGFVRFQDGSTLVLEVSWMLHTEIPGENRQIWIHGDRGGIHLPSNKIFTSDYTTKQLVDRELKYFEQPLEPHAAECVAFADAVVNGKPSPVPAEQSLQVLTILDGLYRSAAAGKEVSLTA